MPSFHSILYFTLIQFLQPLPKSLIPLATSYAKISFSKTKTNSHLYFLRICIRQHLIPVGFSLKHSPSDQTNSRLINATDTILKKASFKLMKSHVFDLTKRLSNLNTLFQSVEHQLQQVLNPSVLLYLKITVINLNAFLFKYMNEIKQRKLIRLRNQLKPFTASNPLILTSSSNYHHKALNVQGSVDSQCSSISNNATPDQNHKLVHCVPSTLPLTDAERDVLSKGLKFIPLQKSCNKFNIFQDCEKFFRSIRWMAVLGHPPKTQIEPDDDEFTSLFKKSSHRDPPRNTPEVETFINRCKTSIQNLHFKPQQSNLLTHELQALSSLQKRDDIVVKPADKGGAVVVWDRDLYIQEALKQLHKKDHYQKVENHSALKDTKKIAKIINDLIKENRLPVTARLLIKQQPRESIFYLLPKIHKLNTPGRPIVSACSCPTENISLYLDSVLQPLVQALPTFVKDTTHALKLIDNINSDSTFTAKTLFTLDVASLYTSIPHEDGLKALAFFLNKRPNQEPSTATLTRLAELVLTMNTFSFNDEVFTQLSGVAMGTKMGPSYACLFMGHLEHEICSQYQGPMPEVYKRYIDDGIGATALSEATLLDFISFINDFHPTIKFTHTISSNTVTFLDLDLTLNNGQISTTVHYKPTDSHSYLDYRSSHTPSTRDSIPYSQFLRLRRLCSDEDDFHSKAAEMSSFFEERHYPSKVIVNALDKVRNIPRQDSLQPSLTNASIDRPVLTLLYHPLTVPVPKIIKSHWHILQSTPNLSDIFDKPPLIAHKRDRNIRDRLVHSKLKCNATPSPGSTPCGAADCTMCPFVLSDLKVRAPQCTFTIKRHFNCQSTNVIYVLLCTLCGALYVGETGRYLSIRFKEHVKDIQYNRNKPVANHFNQQGHSHRHLRVLGLWQMPNQDEKARKDAESYFIQKLGTRSPNGINEKP